MTFLYILLFILILGLIILVHEFGHFVFAKRAGILCHEFSIGMGPALYKKKIGETVYTIRAIPIGGYVAAAGEDPNLAEIKTGQKVFLEIKNNMVEKIYFYRPLVSQTVEAYIVDFDLYGKDGNPLFIVYEHQGVEYRVGVKRDALYVFSEKHSQQIAPYDRCYESKPWFSRFLFVTMGAGFNFLLALVIFLIVYLISGVPTTEPVIHEPGFSYFESAAQRAGLRAGDRIVQMNGYDIHKWDDITAFMNDHYDGGPLVLVVERNGERFERTVYPNMVIGTIGLISDGNNLTDTVIGGIEPNSPADKAGLKIGDRIVKIKGIPVQNWQEIQIALYQTYYEPELQAFLNNQKRSLPFDFEYEMTVIRKNSGEEETIKISPLKIPIDYNELRKETDEVTARVKGLLGQSLIGISPRMERHLFRSIWAGITSTFNQITNVFRTVRLLVGNNNVGLSDLSGPVGIFDMTRTQAMSGALNLLFWVGFISANIGLVNLFPLPALDGGRLIFLLIEGIFRRPIDRKVEGYIHAVGFVLLMILFVYVTFNDIIRLRG